METWNDRNDRNDRTREDRDDHVEGIEAMANALLPDPWDDPHDIEYWVWNGERLVPTTPDEQAAIQEMERTVATVRRLKQWRSEQTRSIQPRPVRGFTGACLVIWRDVRHVVVNARRLWQHGAQSAPTSLDTQQPGPIHLRHGER